MCFKHYMAASCFILNVIEHNILQRAKCISLYKNSKRRKTAPKTDKFTVDTYIYHSVSLAG